METCNFCGKTFEKGTGKLLIKDNGKLVFLCSNKCEKNMFKFKKKGREQKWTNIYHAEKDARTVEKKGDKK